MATDLMGYLQGKSCKEFVSKPQYYQDGDFVAYFERDEIAYEDRQNSLLTIYRSMATREIVGCKIKGVKRILKEIGNFGVVVESDTIQMGLLFIAAGTLFPKHRRKYESYGKRFGGIPIQRSDLPWPGDSRKSNFHDKAPALA